MPPLLDCTGKFIQTNWALTASAVELTWTEGTLDMFVKAEARQSVKKGNEVTTSVSLDKAATPPRLFGMIEKRLEDLADLKTFFEAISVRNTAATGSNDSSSRSHCFVFLTLRVLFKEILRTSRFQFCDLAGSERQDMAHGGKSIKESQSSYEGMLTNYTLMMLSKCVRDLVEFKNSPDKFSFRSYVFELIMLLQESLVGTALTLVVICCSSAPANAANSAQALEFGEVFSRLSVRSGGPAAGEPLEVVRRRALQELEASESGAAGKTKFALLRQNQTRDHRQLLALLDILVSP